MRVTELLEHLTGIDGQSWEPPRIRVALEAAGWTPLEAVGDRESWQLASQQLDMYADPDLVRRVEATLAAAWPDTDDAYQDDLIDEYFAKFEETVAQAREVLGEPRFNDGFGNKGFPDDQDAVWAAVWPRGSGRLMVLQTHEDKELPYRILVVLTP